MKYSYKERFRYYFENTISAGPIGVIKWLGLVSLTVILFLGLIIILFGIKDDPNADHSIGFFRRCLEKFNGNIRSWNHGR